MLTDCHTHTHNSFDAENDTVSERCERAIELGIKAMAVTDHCEINRFYEHEYYNVDAPTEEDVFGYKDSFESSAAEVTAAKELYKDKLTLICGVELGQACSDEEACDKVVNDKRLDFVIGSMHELPGRADFYFLDYRKEDVDKLFREYFDELLKLCVKNKFDVLGHLTYPLRYIEGDYGIKTDISVYRDNIAAVFETLIKNGKGIEINSSGLRQKYGKPFPSYEYLKLYHDMGGKILTFGSDSHSTADIGKGINEVMELAANAGFDKGAYYIKHEPVFFKL